MPQVGEIAWHVQGDIGGVGVSRFRFTRQDAASVTGADANAAAAASRLLMLTTATYTPTAITWSCQPQVNVYDGATGLVGGPLILGTIPTNVTGSGASTYAAGVGGRLNWKTATLSGRRLLRGSTFLVPFASSAYTASGSVAAAAITAVNGGAAAYLAAMVTAVLYPVVWHRPRKGTTVGGLTGIVYAGSLSSTPGGLRSRRS